MHYFLCRVDSDGGASNHGFNWQRLDEMVRGLLVSPLLLWASFTVPSIYLFNLSFSIEPFEVLAFV
jgi:hypothetical protein